VLGVSPDSPSAQKKFKDKYELPYTLLSDPEKKTATAFDVLKEKTMYGKTSLGIERTSFLIGPAGEIVHVFPKVKADGHAEEVLNWVKENLRKAS
jgi:peroxiredoxin Q/BCP